MKITVIKKSDKITAKKPAPKGEKQAAKKTDAKRAPIKYEGC